MRNIKTNKMPFALIIDEDNQIQIDNEIKTSLNIKTHAFKGRDDLSMIEIYQQANLTDRELWELCKIKTEFNNNNLKFENMHAEIEAIQESIMVYWREYKIRLLQ